MKRDGQQMKRNSGTARNWLLRCVFLAVSVTVFAPRILPQSGNAHAPDSPASESRQPETARPPEQADVDRYTLSHERKEKAIPYAKASYTLYFISVFYGVVVLILILRLGIAAKLRDLAQKWSENRILQSIIFAPLLILLVDFLDLPVRVTWHMISLHYQQSIQGWASWFRDWAKEELLGMGIAAVLVTILFEVIRRSPRRWWLYFWFTSIPILLFLVFIMPC